ncbi:hypothetical protein DYB32_004087, partial [Aphanomyces invadans]
IGQWKYYLLFTLVERNHRFKAAPKNAMDMKKRRWLLETYLDSRDYTGAMTLLRFQAKHGERSRLNTLWTAYCLFHMGEYMQALRHYEEVLVRTSSQLRSCDYFDLAKNALAQVIEPDAAMADAQQRLRLLLAQRTKDTGAIHSLLYEQSSTVSSQLASAAVLFHERNFQGAAGHALVEHNLVVFRDGELALRLWPALVDTVAEAQLNLALFHIKHDKFDKAYDMLDAFEPAQPIEYIFATALVYLKSIAMYHVHDDTFNWNYGVALAATGGFSEGENVLGQVQNPQWRQEYTYLAWLARCHIRSITQSQLAWDLYLKGKNSTDALQLLKLIANEYYLVCFRGPCRPPIAINA